MKKLLLLFTITMVACTMAIPAQVEAACTPTGLTSIGTVASSGVAMIAIQQLPGCTIYLDRVNVSIWTLNTAYAQTVYIGGNSNSNCNSFTNYSAIVPLGVPGNDTEDKQTLDFTVGGQGTPLPTGGGTYYCVKFGGWSSGVTEYISILDHQQ
jgi:hypothetical protein